MEVFADFLAKIANPAHRARTEEILTWVKDRFPQLEPQLKWNQPMFTDHGTFIIGFSTAKQHLSVAPDEKTMKICSEDIAKSGYSATQLLFRIRWDEPVQYDLLEKLIAFTIEDKADVTKFWR